MKSGTGKWYYWVILAVLFKSVMFSLLTYELGTTTDSYIGISDGNEIGDARSYLQPVENLIQTGNYDPDYRMPGYAAIYYLFRMIFSIPGAQNALVVLQSLLSALSVYALARSAYLLFKSTRIFYLVFFAFLISTYTQILDLYLITESLSVSASIFAVYYFIRGSKENKNSFLFISGIWITWLIFLRPVYVPYLLLFIGILFVKGVIIRIPRQTIFKGILILLTPFIIVDGIWIIRNYSKYSTIQPLTKSLLFPDVQKSYYIELMSFLQSWGGSYIFWDPSAEIHLLGIEESTNGIPFKGNEDIKFPENIYTTQFNSDSLSIVRTLVSSLQKEIVSKDSIGIVNDILTEKLRRYTQSVISEHPFIYHVTSRLKYFKIFLIHSGTYNLMRDPWSDLGLIRKAIKIFYSAFYLYLILTGFAGCILLFLHSHKHMYLIFPALAVYSILIFLCILRLPEMRYFVPAYPFMLICSMYVTNAFINRLNQNKLTANKS